MRRVGGTISLQVGGEVQNAKGEFTYSFGTPKIEPVVGSDKVHGVKVTPNYPYVEGAITDRRELDVQALFNGFDQTVTLNLTNGKVLVLREACYAGDGTVKTDEGEIAVRWIGAKLEEIR
jgi:hypothetical protein